MPCSPYPSMTRRNFCSNAVAAACGIPHVLRAQLAEGVHFNVAEYDRARILAAANDALNQAPQTVTTTAAPLKALNRGTYYSEDPEWFPAATETKMPYEHRQGYTNPQAFTAHRDALVRMNGIVAVCVAAWRLTGETRYPNHAILHLRAWFMDAETRMEPNLEHAATVPPAADGNYRGVEETVSLAETVRATSFLCAYNGVATEEEATALRKWFGDYSTWLNESKKGMIAREAKDRLAICWTLQAAECARFARNSALSLECSHRFKEKLLRQMNLDGEFPLELHRANAYASSLFTLDCLATTCEVLSSPLERLWELTLPDGRGMRSAVAFLFPAIESRARWKYPADVQHFTDWPVRQPSLLLAGRAFGRPEYLEVWKRLPAEPNSAELLRTFPIRQPALWTVRPPA
ncbi:alginate lyase family protein [Terriglobus roseus]|uniref:Alginate lyase n=1 Tax=Terriglobus roseus TaxID=392734 RepID=A0A1H4TW35_9BACT|nr:alginate lyase family protein [Terriglobus roseus]SEC60234.1 Alginate lyase [Terriglobus roseus]